MKSTRSWSLRYSGRWQALQTVTPRRQAEKLAEVLASSQSPGFPLPCIPSIHPGAAGVPFPLLSSLPWPPLSSGEIPNTQGYGECPKMDWQGMCNSEYAKSHCPEHSVGELCGV